MMMMMMTMMPAVGFKMIAMMGVTPGLDARKQPPQKRARAAVARHVGAAEVHVLEEQRERLAKPASRCTTSILKTRMTSRSCDGLFPCESHTRVYVCVCAHCMKQTQILVSQSIGSTRPRRSRLCTPPSCLPRLSNSCSALFHRTPQTICSSLSWRLHPRPCKSAETVSEPQHHRRRRSSPVPPRLPSQLQYDPSLSEPAQRGLSVSKIRFLARLFHFQLIRDHHLMTVLVAPISLLRGASSVEVRLLPWKTLRGTRARKFHARGPNSVQSCVPLEATETQKLTACRNEPLISIQLLLLQTTRPSQTLHARTIPSEAAFASREHLFSTQNKQLRASRWVPNDPWDFLKKARLDAMTRTEGRRTLSMWTADAAFRSRLRLLLVVKKRTRLAKN
mmetsp:Transcript_1542/g.3266  ORF Transcript_1542/g.3266 Transcript_1542/m.3266 type:complete len:392 (-) Transcript_1542:344-1519(-)